MSGTPKTLLKNLFFGVFGEAVSGGLNFLTMILVARHLSTTAFGNFSAILAFVGVFQLFADMGLTNTLVREIARERERVEEILGALRPLAWLTTLVIFLVVAIAGWLFYSNVDLYAPTLVMGLAVLATFHSFSYGSVCRAFEEMGYNAAGNVSHKILQIVLVWFALQSDAQLIGVASAMLIANIFQWLFFRQVVRSRYAPNLRWRYDFPYWKYLVTEAVPVGIAMVFRRANQQIGILVLTAMSSSASVGLFSAAYKILQMIDMIPFTLSLPFFPHMSRLALESPEKLFGLLERLWRLFMIIAAPIVVWLFVMSPRLVELLFGVDYAAAAGSLRILSITILFLFITAIFAYVFMALRRQRFYTMSSALCLLVNVVFSVFLIPRFDHQGAAGAALAGEVFFCVSGMLMLRTLGFKPNILRIFGAPIGFAVAATPLLYSAATSGWGVVILNSAVYALIYLVFIVVSGTLHNDERGFIFSVFTKRAAS